MWVHSLLSNRGSSLRLLPADGDGGSDGDAQSCCRFGPVVMNPFDGPGSPRHEEQEEAGRAESRSRWARFSSWLECACVVTFDLELGQAIEVR